MDLVGKTIYTQLRTLDTNSLFAWGSSSFKIIQKNQLENENNKNHLGGLVFKVNGLKHKKHVLITLNANDLYDIQIGSLTKGQFVQKKGSKTYNDVFFEDLIERIDDLVEGYFENKNCYDNVKIF